MKAFVAEVLWMREGQTFTDKRYSRRHLLRFDGGIDVVASSSPHVVAVPYSEPMAVDPEEAFVASLSSCHMLWFLSIAAEQGYIVDSYRDRAEGLMAKDACGKTMVGKVTLHPEVAFSGSTLPGQKELDALHALAHEECFIANSVKTIVRCESRLIERH